MAWSCTQLSEEKATPCRFSSSTVLSICAFLFAMLIAQLCQCAEHMTRHFQIQSHGDLRGTPFTLLSHKVCWSTVMWKGRFRQWKATYCGVCITVSPLIWGGWQRCQAEKAQSLGPPLISCVQHRRTVDEDSFQLKTCLTYSSLHHASGRFE